MASILIVDDDRAVQLIIRLLLEREGHRTTCASDGPTALRSISLLQHVSDSLLKNAQEKVLVPSSHQPELNFSRRKRRGARVAGAALPSRFNQEVPGAIHYVRVACRSIPR
jgi:hypothetical protein